METKENNKLIAEFMEFKIPTHIRQDQKWIKAFISKLHLHYNTSWDWLMPVVEKIESELTDGNVFTIEKNYCNIPVPYGVFDIVTEEDTKLESVYKAVVQYVSFKSSLKED
jgi:hypothetical protein